MVPLKFIQMAQRSDFIIKIGKNQLKYIKLNFQNIYQRHICQKFQHILDL